MKLTLPYPPSVNTLYYSGFDKKRHLSEKGRAYKKNVYADVLEQHGVFKPLTGPLSATIKIWVPDKRKRDLDNTFKILLDNTFKILLDSLKYANVYLDDDQIMQIHGYKLEKVKGGKCIVEIEELEDEINE